MILRPFLRRPGRDPTIRALYGMIVAQARSPAFYTGYGVPDTVSARIDMIMLHLVLVLRHLRSKPAADRPIDAEQGQELFDLFCQDMDDNFREMGVGDLKVPKEMQRIAEAFYGRAQAYDAALDSADEAALVAALERNIFDAPQPLGTHRLAAYMQQTVRLWAGTGNGAAAGAGLTFPAPDTIAAGGSPGG